MRSERLASNPPASRLFGAKGFIILVLPFLLLGEVLLDHLSDKVENMLDKLTIALALTAIAMLTVIAVRIIIYVFV